MPTDLLRTVVGAIHDVAIVCDAEYRVLAWNGRAEGTFGIGATVALGKQLDQLPGLDLCPLARRAIRQIVDRDGHWRGEARQERGSSGDGLLEWSISRFDMAGSTSVAYLGVAHEVDHQHRLHDELQRSEQRYRTLLGAMNEGFALHDILSDGDHQPTDLRFLVVNPAFERLTGHDAAELIGKIASQVTPQLADKLLTHLSQMPANGDSRQFDHRLERTGRQCRVTMLRAPLHQVVVLFGEQPPAVTSHASTGA